MSTEPMQNAVDIELAGEVRTMRATFSALRGIERDLGKSILAVINTLGSYGDMAITDAATIIYHGLRGNQDTRLTFEQVGDAIVSEGFNAKSVKIVDFLNIALNGVQVGKPQAPAEPESL